MMQTDNIDVAMLEGHRTLAAVNHFTNLRCVIYLAALVRT
jgi:hypothetical protein